MIAKPWIPLEEVAGRYDLSHGFVAEQLEASKLPTRVIRSRSGKVQLGVLVGDVHPWLARELRVATAAEIATWSATLNRGPSRRPPDRGAARPRERR